MTRRQQRMVFVAVIVAGVALAVALSLKAFQENILYYYLPSQLAEAEPPANTSIRLGGMVADDSIRRVPGSLTVSFTVTDGKAEVPVVYTGVLPDLFREGQGIVAIGRLEGGTLQASEVLAKHDENYMPPDVAKTVEEAHAAARAAREAGQ